MWILLKRLHDYFSKIENPSNDEKSILTGLTGALPYFEVTHVHRDDLRSQGFDVTAVSDANMTRLAKEMESRYCNGSFWEDLEYAASEKSDIPLEQKDNCPVCDSVLFSFDFTLNKFVCQSCNQTWSDSYVLVQFPEDASHFENEDIGFPCFRSDDNGARYVPEYDYLQHYKKAPAPESLFRPVVWPESQNWLHSDDDRREVIMADEKALMKFGGSAVWVPKCLIEK